MKFVQNVKTPTKEEEQKELMVLQQKHQKKGKNQRTTEKKGEVWDMLVKHRRILYKHRHFPDTQEHQSFLNEPENEICAK